MYIPNKYKRKPRPNPPPGRQVEKYALVLSLLLILMVGRVFPQLSKEARFPFKSSRGLEIMILKSDHIPFIHAQLLIYYKEKIKNPAISYLTLLNIFDNAVDKSGTSVLNILRKLGNDFEVEQRPDFLLFKINFLPDKRSQFIKFLKELYHYKPFLQTDSGSGTYSQRKRQINTSERFKDSIANYWKYFFKKKQWKKKIAYQLAYRHLFSPNLLGNTLITPDSLKNVDLDHLRAFYRRTYKLSNSRLIIKGNIENPALLFGSIERAFSSFKKQEPRKYAGEKLIINHQKKVIVFNTNRIDPPILFWFDPVSTLNNRAPVPSMLLNSVLFGYPTGRLFLNARYFNINNLRLNSEMTNHKGVSVICNTIRLRYKDIENFILLADREKKKLRMKRVDRKEYLDNLTHIYGSMKVNSQNFENNVNLEIFDPLYRSPNPKDSNVTLAGLNQVIDNSNRNQGIIVIVGNAKIISRNLTILKPQVQVIDFGIR